MSPEGGGTPDGELADAIGEEFGGFEAFRDQLSSAASGQFGSGWAWLVVDGSRLAIVQTPNQDSPIGEGKAPVLGLDVWEHAYSLKYRNKRDDYIAAWWNVVHWHEVARRFDEVRGAAAESLVERRSGRLAADRPAPEEGARVRLRDRMVSRVTPMFPPWAVGQPVDDRGSKEKETIATRSRDEAAPRPVSFLAGVHERAAPAGRVLRRRRGAVRRGARALRTWAVAAGAVAFAVGAVACGNGGGGEADATQPATVTETAQTETAATEPAETETTALPGDPQQGLQVFNAQGCGSCHTLAEADATGTIGPNLDEQLVESAERAGEPLPEFTRESIVSPDAFIAEGFSAGVMPENYGEQLSDEELDDLVAFIVQSVRD